MKWCWWTKYEGKLEQTTGLSHVEVIVVFANSWCDGALMADDWLAVVQTFSHVQLFVTPWTAARQASLSCAISQSLLKLISFELVMPSNHLILCCPILLMPSIFSIIRIFSSQLFTSGDQSTGASASVSILSIRFRVLFPLGLTGLISLLSKGLSRVFSNTTVQKHQFFGTQPSSWSNSHIRSRLLDKP